jgi:proteasome assembly chaperone (PAC2) family protein
MSMNPGEFLHLHHPVTLDNATLLLGFSGWMDGGDVSTGTVQRLVDLLEARPFAEIDPDPFYLYNFPGSMELAALFRPNIEIEEGLVKAIDMPSSTFYYHQPANLVFFLGKEPNLRWRTFGDCIISLAHQVGVRRILFVGSFGGSVPHTRQPRLFVACSDANLLPEMQRYGLARTGYEGPGSFTSYLLSRASSANLEMASLVAEVPGYLQGPNPMSIEAVTRRLAQILLLPLNLDALRTESTQWELEITSVIEENEELMARVRQLEEQYDNELLEQDGE